MSVPAPSDDPQQQRQQQRQDEINRYRTTPATGQTPAPSSPTAASYPQPQPMYGRPQMAGYPQQYGYPPGMTFQPPAGMWDVIRDGVKYLAQYKLIEILFLIVLLLIGYGLFGFFVYVEPRRQAENAAAVERLSKLNNETVEKIVGDHKSALHETKEAFITESLQLRQDARTSSERHLLMMERLVEKNARANFDRDEKDKEFVKKSLSQDSNQ